MGGIRDPQQKPLPDTTPDERELFLAYGQAMLAGDRKKAERLAQECLFGPSLTRLFETAFAELTELSAAAEGLSQLQADHDRHEQQLRRLYQLRPASLAESEEVQARIDSLLAGGAPLRQRLNDAKSANIRAASIAAFLGSLLGPRESRTVSFPLVNGTATCDIVFELRISPTRDGWRELLRPDPRPKRRKWLRAVGL